MPYNTKSNKVRIIKTPGGELRYLHLKKQGTAPKCGDCGTKLPGVRLTSPTQLFPRLQNLYLGNDGRCRCRCSAIRIEFSKMECGLD